MWGKGKGEVLGMGVRACVASVEGVALAGHVVVVQPYCAYTARAAST